MMSNDLSTKSILILTTTIVDLATSVSLFLLYFVETKKRKMKITITGSLGNISKSLTKELVQKGHQVTVISSNPERQKEIEALGGKAGLKNTFRRALLNHLRRI